MLVPRARAPEAGAVDAGGMPLRTHALTADDDRLVTAAPGRRVVGDSSEPERHRLGAAVRMRDGRVFAGVHVEAYVGRITLRADAVALGAARPVGARGVATVVAVAHWPGARHPAVSPCGVCRELVSDYGLDVSVIIPSVQGPPRKVAVLDVLPAKYAWGDPAS
jgi:cytidine deaminase